MPSITVENYIKQIYLQRQRARTKLLPMGRLAAALSVAPGTVTAMAKSLAEEGLVHYEPRGGIRLTAAGHAMALNVLRRHRLVELFLVDVLGLDWSEVHDEAEELEHAISEKVLERIDEMLGRPSTDPHGDPIPTAKGKVPKPRLKTLAESPRGRRLRITRITDQRGEFLQLLNRCRLTPGSTVVVESRDDIADAITVRPDKGESVTIGLGAAAKILVADVKS